MLLIIDNYDSFTYNIVHYFRELGEEVKILRNDAASLAEIHELAPDRLVISPGPCTPQEAGISMEAVRYYSGRIPILGICLGHQSIAAAFGAKIVRARKVMHGKTSLIRHDQRGVFEMLPDPFVAARYHSLVVLESSLPDCFEVSARAAGSADEAGEVMGIRHRDLPLEGVQFHPEAIMSEHGHRLLQNFCRLSVHAECYGDKR